MYIKIKVSHLIIGVVLLGSLLWGGVALAGDPDSGGDPALATSFSLEDLYQRLTTGVAGTQSAFTEPGAGPDAGTMHTINEIMDAAPALDNSTGATRTQVMSGVTYWGLRDGAWGLQTGVGVMASGNATDAQVLDGRTYANDSGVSTGAMPDNGAGSTIAPATTDQNIAAGYWSSANTVLGDADLVAGNIVSGTAIFGVNGSAVIAGGNATDAQVLDGRTYANDSGVSTGAMPDNGAGSTIVPATTDQNIAAGYWSSANTVLGDADLVAGNIAQGVTLFGVTGTLTGSNSYNAGVPKTGQTTSYAPGDDGDLQMGVAWPNPRFTDNGDGTVTDNLTGLIWLAAANCGRSMPTGSWSSALSKVVQLNTDGTMHGTDCGDTSNKSGRQSGEGTHQTDWRLPNIRELNSLIHYAYYQNSKPVIPNTAGTGQWSEGDPFTNVFGSRYWSSTTPDGWSATALYINLYNGVVARFPKEANVISFFVWPVRGGQ